MKNKGVCIGVDVAFINLTGNVAYGLLLSQFVYWASKSTDPDGWFTYTGHEIEDFTGMKRSEQESARKVMRHLGILQEVKKGIPSKLYYRINFTELKTKLIEKELYNEVRHVFPFHEESKSW